MATRRAKRRQQQQQAHRAAERAPHEQRRSDVAAGDPERRWRTFPVLAAFVVGLLIASIVNGRPANEAAAALQIAAIFGVGYVLAHLFVLNVIVAGRIRRREAARAAAAGDEDDDGEWVDEVVHPDERAAPR